MITIVTVLTLFILTLQGVLLVLVCLKVVPFSVSGFPFFIPEVQIVIYDYLHPF